MLIIRVLHVSLRTLLCGSLLGSALAGASPGLCETLSGKYDMLFAAPDFPHRRLEIALSEDGRSFIYDLQWGEVIHGTVGRVVSSVTGRREGGEGGAASTPFSFGAVCTGARPGPMCLHWLERLDDYLEYVESNLLTSQGGRAENALALRCARGRLRRYAEELLGR
jgi:hypothetical protein